MSEAIPIVIPGGMIQLKNDSMSKNIGEPMTPEEAAFLARSLLACAGLIALKAAENGKLYADAHLPVLKWQVTSQTGTGNPVVIFSVPPGIDLTFQVTRQTEREFGAALVAHAEGSPPPEQPPDMVH
jgi:hypothetical protein